MTPYTISIRFHLDRETDRDALSWLSQSRTEGFKSNSAAVVAAINEYRSIKERLAADPYLETRDKEDAFLQKVLDTVQRGMRESSIANYGRLIAALQNAVPASDDHAGAEAADETAEAAGEGMDEDSYDQATSFLDTL